MHASNLPAHLSHEHVSQEVHLKLLDDFLAIVRDLNVPTEFTPLILWHPDLHRTNLMVREHGPPDITGFLDWQHSWVGPRFLHILYPPAFRYPHAFIDTVDAETTPSLPDNFDTLDPSIQEQVREELRMVEREHLYLQTVGVYDRPRFVVLYSKLYPPMATSFQQMSDPRPDGVAEVAFALAKLSRNWGLVGKPGSKCPLSYSDDELLPLIEDEERMQVRETLIQVYCTKAGIDLNGGVDPEHYEKAKKYHEQARDEWDETYGPWFAEDGARSSLL